MISKNQKKTIAQKLIREVQSEVPNSSKALALVDRMPDIEDATGAVKANKSPFFSPIQTRQQRKLNANPPYMVLTEKQRQPIKTDGIVQASLPNIIHNKPLAKLPEKIKNGNEFNNKESVWKPEHWEQVLQNIRKMREVTIAPVDSMGCHKCADEDADDMTQRFQKLVALMLSSQTKDETTFEAMQRLKQHTLTPNSLANMDTKKLEDLLRPVSFYKNKAKYLQQTAKILIEHYQNDIPNNIKELVALPGVGPKMAHICMATAWQEVTGVGVDVHVHRIANRLGWVESETKHPEHTRIALERWLPRELWREVNHLLVGFGQVVCMPVRPKCSSCLNMSICPAAGNYVKSGVVAKDSSAMDVGGVKYNSGTKISSKRKKMKA